ncbi:MAG: FTR1 family protein, partial [Anaerolineae bacterium]
MMIASLLITLREGLEAALIVGIVLSVLRKLGHADRSRPVWAGVLVAVVVSVAIGLVLNGLGVTFEGRGEEIFEGVAMLLAAVVLTWMIFWMQRQGRQIQAELESDVRRAVTTGSAWALFGLAFVAVVREGIETVLFLTAAAFSATPAQTLTGGALGLIAAVVLG